MALGGPGTTRTHSYPCVVQKSTPLHPGCSGIDRIVLNDPTVWAYLAYGWTGKTHGRIVDLFTPEPALMD